MPPNGDAKLLTTQRKILFVDDDPLTRVLTAELIDSFGHAVAQAGSADEALPLLADEHFDVLLTDVSLPGMNGVELARKALALQPMLAVVFASGYGAALDLAPDLTHAPILGKPYDIERLERLLAAPPRDRDIPSMHS
ncbi:MAG: response regulator [Janthinobacterium lividum]